MPNTALPSTFAGTSMRGRLRPMSFHWLAILEGDLAHRQHRGLAREFAEVGAQAELMADHSVFDAQLVDGHPPFQRCRAEQPGPRRSRCKAQHVPGVCDGGRAARRIDAELPCELGDRPAGELDGGALMTGLVPGRMGRHGGDEHRDVAVDLVCAGLLQANARQRHVEFLGHQHRKAGVHALPHLAAVHRQHHRAIGPDLDPAIEADFAVSHRQAVASAQPAARRQKPPADDERAAHSQRAQEKAAALHAVRTLLVRSPPGRVGRICKAADLIASRTRG